MNTLNNVSSLASIIAPLTKQELSLIRECRNNSNRLGFCYQLVFVKTYNRFPEPCPLEIITEILDFASTQLEIESCYINSYQKRRQTLYEHQKRILDFLHLKRLDQSAIEKVNLFIAEQTMRFTHLSLLMNQTKFFLKENHILQPGEIILKRIIASQKEKTSQLIFSKINSTITQADAESLNQLLISTPGKPSVLQMLKLPPSAASSKGLIILGKKIELLVTKNVHLWDLSWLHPNYQRQMARYAYHCSIVSVGGSAFFLKGLIYAKF